VDGCTFPPRLALNDAELRDERLVDYLLGRLSDEEAQRYDERSIADDEFVWRLRDVENDLIDAYVRGLLTGETCARFRTVYMASPRRRERVMFARTLADLDARYAFVVVSK
jgi:hypothetical protein